jgi:hypothetical protein
VARFLGCLLVMLIVTTSCRQAPTTPAPSIAPSSPIPTVSAEPSPTIPVLPTPSVPVDLPPSCSMASTMESLQTFLWAVSRTDLPLLRQLILTSETTTMRRWFAVIPREPDRLATGLFAERPEAFLDWVEQRALQRERWSILEFLRFQPEETDRVRVTAALLREADDLLAKPMVTMIELDCQRGTVVSVIVGAIGGQDVPERAEDLLASALSQRPLRGIEGSPNCPRSPWAFGTAVGEGPVYLEIGPDAVVNLGNLIDRGQTARRASVIVGASERGPVLLRLFRATDLSLIPSVGERSVWFIEPDAATPRRIVLDLPVDAPGCYVLQADGPTWQTQLVFEVVPETIEFLAPTLAGVTLPVQLQVLSAVRDGPESVRVSLAGPTLVVRMQISLGGLGTPYLGPATHCTQELDSIELCWTPHPVWGWPQTAVWDDGIRRYQLAILAGGRDAWSENDLLELVRQVSRSGSD